MRSRPGATLRPVPATLLLSLLLACKADPSPDTGDPSPVDPRALSALSVSSDHRIVDALDREVLLRGVNLTSLGEYWQGHPELPPTQPTTEEDWAALQAHGVRVVRLVVHWSRLEPTRGEVDGAYLDEIDAHVQAAAAHGIYTVIDMHQDAFSAFIWTPLGEEECPKGSSPAKGWDGAPQWATLTDGLSTCITGDRNSSPAVIAAWDHFYDDTDGIRGRFVATWLAVAERFAGRSEVAGFDLLNEPETSRPSSELTPLYDALLVELITGIRATGAEQLLILEPAIPAGDRSNGLVFADPSRLPVDPTNLVNGTHNYAESIDATGLSLETTNDLMWAQAESQGTGYWVGEYGFWSTDPAVLEVATRYALDEDEHAQGGAWWQWRQPCGDPHSLELVDGAWQPTDTVVHLNTLDCVNGVDLGPTDPFLAILGRGYPHAAPGRIRRLESDPATGRLRVEGEVEEAGGTLVVWTPTSGEAHETWTEGLEGLAEEVVGQGRILTATVAAAGDYALGVDPR